MSTVLLVGSGAREHVMAWKLAQSPQVTRLILAPGNDGMFQDEARFQLERWPFDLKKENFLSLAEKANEEKVDLAVIGPDNPLADGIVDVLKKKEIPCFGPDQKGAQIEASKSFAKEVMIQAGVPTAKGLSTESIEEAENFLKKTPWGSGWVVKADGLAYGKGVVVCEDLDHALRAVHQLYPLSQKLVIEEKLQGQELSWMALCQGEDFVLLEPARDYKRLLAGNQGPNTGGMGSYSPVPEFQSEAWSKKISDQVFKPVLKELKKRGIDYRGVLYAGLMISGEKFWVLEFNARFGDPETQVIFPRWEDDFFEYANAVAQGKLSTLPSKLRFSSQSVAYVVAAAKGYPESPEKGQKIEGPLHEGALDRKWPSYFFAGIKKNDHGFETSGGRVLGGVGKGETLSQALEEAYLTLGQIRFDGLQFRKDIGS